MLKYIFIIFLSICGSLFADYQDDLFTEAISEIEMLISAKVDSSSVIIYGNFQGNNGEQFLNHLLTEFTKTKKYSFVNRSDLKKIFYEQVQLSDPIYDTQTQSVRFKTPQWLLEGESSYHQTRHWGKKKAVLKIDMTLSNINYGTNDIIFTKEFSKEWNPPLMFSVLLSILMVIFCRFLVQKFKGYHYVLIYGSGILMLFLYYLWLFL